MDSKVIKNCFVNLWGKIKSVLSNKELKQAQSDLEQRLQQLYDKEYPDEDDIVFLLDNDYHVKAGNPNLFNRIIDRFNEYLVSEEIRPSHSLPIIPLIQWEAVENVKVKFRKETFGPVSTFIRASCYCIFADDEEIKAEDVIRYFPIINRDKGYLRRNDIYEYVVRNIEGQCRKLEYILGTEGENERAVNYASKIKTEMQCLSVLINAFRDFPDYIARRYQNAYALMNSGRF